MVKKMTLNPYNSGLLIAGEIDLVLTNLNSEPVSPSDYLKDKKYKIEHSYGNHNVNENYFTPKEGMVRLYSASSHCRAWAIDNLWITLKELLVQLKKKSFISFHSNINDSNDKIITASGNVKLTISEDGVYSRKGEVELRSMILGPENNKLKKRLIRNMHLTLGILGCLLDRRPCAEIHRKKYSPTKKICLRHTKSFLTYQGLTNFWVYHPSLTHLIMGAARMAVFITLNNETYKFCKIKEFKLKEIEEAIRDSDYEKIEYIWSLISPRFNNLNHPTDSNPFTEELLGVIDFIQKFGLGVLGPGVYNNWRLKRKKQNYRGHLSDLISWESGVRKRILTKKNELYDEFMGVLDERKKQASTSKKN